MDWLERTLLHIIEHLPFLQTDTEGGGFISDAEHVGDDVGLGFVETDEIVENPLELLVDIIIVRWLNRGRLIEDIVNAVDVGCSGTVFRSAATSVFILTSVVDIVVFNLMLVSIDDVSVENSVDCSW